MRLDVNDLRPDQVALSKRAIVTVNGEPLDGCIVADEEAGYVEYLAENPYPDATEWLIVRIDGIIKITDPN